MNLEFEGLDSILCEFNDDDTPPGVTVRPVDTAQLLRVFRMRLVSEEALARRDDRQALEQGVAAEREDCLRARDRRGAAYCLGNLALLLKIKGDRQGALKLAEEAQREAVEVGTDDLAAGMEAVRQQSNGPSPG